MSRDEDKLIRQLSLLSFLLSRPRPFTAREIQESVEGYAEMSDETFTRRFFADRADLAKIGIEVRALSGTDPARADDAQLFVLSEGDFRLPPVEFTPAEARALVLALAALDGRFAYARPLRLALTAILHGRRDSFELELEHLPVALAPDEDAIVAGRQLSRLEDAVTRGKTVRFSYPAADGTTQERTLDPYSLFLIQGHWYVVGRDHGREAIRTFRLGRIRGPVKMRTERSRDFTVPADYSPEEYRARPPWLIGPIAGAATIKVDELLSWWVKRLEPHVQVLREDDDGCTFFAVPYADQSVLLSWVAGLGGSAQLTEPLEIRKALASALAKVGQAHRSALPTAPEADPIHRPSRAAHASMPAHRTEPIAAEHLARAMTLLYYLVDEQRPSPIPWQALEEDLGLSRADVEADLSLVNLVNFGGGTYALFAEAGPDGVEVTPDIMAGTFAQPARLSPVMARALLLALDLLGDTLAFDGLESLASVRDKVRTLAGDDRAGGTVIVDDVLPADPQMVEIFNRAIREHSLVKLEYYTGSRRELGERTVEPYLLFRSPDGWYLEAYCLKARGQRTFKLERIRNALATATVFTPRPEVDLTRRREGRAFLSRDVASWATVRFHSRWKSYLEEQGLECLPGLDGRVEVRMPYLDEHWIAQEIVRYLGDAELLHPASARRLVHESARALAALYAGEAPHRPDSPSVAPGGAQ
jgi:predicted DNA-binding transcriptional regulator YafY